MHSLKSDMIYFLLVSFNYITDTLTYYKTKYNELYQLYNDKNRGKWIFFPDMYSQLLPLELIHNNNSEIINNKWIYNSNNNTLINSNSTNKVNINWLSAEIHKYGDIDINIR